MNEKELRNLMAGGLNSVPQDNNLSITDFANSGFQLHIHDGPGGTGHLKTYGGDYHPLSSNQSAMGELYARNLGIGKPLDNSVDLYGMLKKINY